MSSSVVFALIFAANGASAQQPPPPPPPAPFVQGGNAFGTTAVLGTTDANPLDIRVGNSRAMRYFNAPISPNLIGGNATNGTVRGVRGATIAGGGIAEGVKDPDVPDAVDLCQGPNRVTGHYGTVGGGFCNAAGAGGTTPGWSSSTVAGGDNNWAKASHSAVGGGVANFATGQGSTVAGGIANAANGLSSVVPGGHLNSAAGDYSFAAGLRAKANGDGVFTFADSNDFDFVSNTPNSFRVRATGGVRFVTDIDFMGNATYSCLAAPGASWACSSDRNQKQNLRQLDGLTVLQRVVALPVYEWNPKGRNAHVNHYGPTAQDFHAAFGLGDDDKLIGLQDADGVALAAIQGLNARMEARDQTIETLKAEIAELRRAIQVQFARPGVGDEETISPMK